jgi:hypothetical protein
MFRRILPYAVALAAVLPVAAHAAAPAPTGVPGLLQLVDDHDGPPPPWLWNHDHDHDYDHDHDRHHRRDDRGHWVPAHVEWHHHHRIWIPGHWDRT